MILCGAVASLSPVVNAVTVTFEDLTPTQLYAGGGAFENGAVDQPNFQSGPLTFETGYSSDFGGSWQGWAYSNTTDVTTPGFGNQYSAFPGGGGNTSSTYVVGTRFGQPIDLAIPAGFDLSSLQLAITTYAAQYILSADDSFATRSFGGDDSIRDLLQVEIKGLLGGTEVASPLIVTLADSGLSSVRSEYITSNDWIDVDLTSLADADQLEFTIINDQGGVPSYFALDNVELIAVPEPSSTMLSLGVFGVFLLRRSRS